MPSIWWPRQMPKVGISLSMMSRITGTAYSPVAAGSPGPLERKTPSGLSAMTSAAGACARTTPTLPPFPGSWRRMLRLVPSPAGLAPFEPLPRGHHWHEGHADEARPFTRLLLEELQVESSGRRVGDDRVGHALDANEPRERPRVHAAQPDHAACLEPFVEVTRCAIVRRRGYCSAENNPARSRGRGHVDGFDVFLVRPHVADMRECERDDLAGIGGIGENFLITGHGGIEADLPDRMPDGAKAEAFEHGPIGEHEQCGRLRLDPCALRLPMLRLFVVLRWHKSRLFPCSAGRSRASPQSRRP